MKRIDLKKLKQAIYSFAWNANLENLEILLQEVKKCETKYGRNDTQKTFTLARKELKKYSNKPSGKSKGFPFRGRR